MEDLWRAAREQLKRPDPETTTEFDQIVVATSGGLDLLRQGLSSRTTTSLSEVRLLTIRVANSSADGGSALRHARTSLSPAHI